MNNEQEKRIVLRAISHMAKATELMRVVDTNTRAWTSALNMLDTLYSITMIAYGDETIPVKKTKKKPVKKKKPAIRKKTK